MEDDPILAEIHAIRAKIAKECNYDIKAIAKYFDSMTIEDCKKAISKAVRAENGTQKKVTPARGTSKSNLAPAPRKLLARAKKNA